MIIACAAQPDRAARTSKERDQGPQRLIAGGGGAWMACAAEVLSRSRAAIPATRTRGPSAQNMGPSPSQTRVGVQANSAPATMIAGMADPTSCRERNE